jgi:SPP1 gp7 family putative phage head morphogenesis protein
MAEPTFNERILDANIAHQVGLLRFREGLVDRVLVHLEDVERDLRRQLTDRLSRIQERGADLGPATTKRLRTMLAGVRETLGVAYRNAGQTLRAELFELSKFEVDFQARLIQANTPFVDLAFVIPPGQALRSIVTSQPMRGAILRDLLRRAETNAVRRAAQAVRIGLTEGETVRQMVTRVAGVNGLGLGKRGMTSLVRTSVTHVTARAREELYSANSDIVAGVMWVSTLDSRTTAICQRLDGQVFEPNDGPRPPAHIACRSATTPVLNGQSDVWGDRASQVGPVPAKQTYGEWLGRRSAAFQDDVLGATRGALFRRGGLTVDKFVDFRGRKFTLDELKLREPSAFRRAGI